MNMTQHGWSRMSIRRHLCIGFALVALVAGGVGGWAATTEISGAIIASGSIVVDSNIKKIQHRSGGIVSAILVGDGDQVAAGDIVLRLDPTISAASRAIVQKRLMEFKARKVRLEAERDRARIVRFPDNLLASNKEPAVAEVLAGERQVFRWRRAARIGQKSQLRQRVGQINEEILGLTAQAKAKSKEIVLIQRELKGARRLWAKKLMPISKLTAIEREATRVEGERAKLVANIARLRGTIIETKLQIIQIDRDFTSAVVEELGETNAKIGEFAERKIAADDELKHVDIRAPLAGTVHQSIAHTVGGVIKAGETIMLIVPNAEDLTVEANVAPQDIDQLQLGQKAMLRFAAFNQRTTPEIRGTLSRISADITIDERLGTSYYTIRIAIPGNDVSGLGDVKLVPGMPVEAFVKTGDRKVISYLIKPLSDQFMRSFRER